MKKASGKSIKVSSRKAKGRSLQQMVCKEISKFLAIPWGKDEEIASREMGQSGVDVKLSPRVRKIFPFSIETKNQERWTILQDIEQAKSNCYPDTDWVLVLKKNRVSPVVVMDFNAWIKLVSCYRHD